MKKAITSFLTVGFVLSIVAIVVGVILIPVGIVKDPVNTSDIARGIYFILAGVANLVGMIIIRKKWPQIKSKDQVTKIAVWSIVLGAILTVFPIPAGILMLVLPAEEYGKQE